MEAEFSRQRLLDGLVVTVIRGLVLDRRDVADHGVQAVVVEPVDPAQGGQFEVVDTAERSVVVDAFGFVGPRSPTRP